MANVEKRGAWVGYWPPDAAPHDHAGRIWQTTDGRRVYVIRRQLNGTRFEVSTRTSSLTAAMEHYRRFQADPEKYRDHPEGERRPEAVYLTEKLVEEFLDWSAGRGNSRGWLRNQKQHLGWWADQLRGRDLRAGHTRSVSIPDLRAALRGATSARQKEAVLRTLYTWLRGGVKLADGLAVEFSASDDPTWGKPWVVAPGRPAQETTDKFIDPADLATVLGHLDEVWATRGKTDKERDARGRRWGDILRLLDGCGMHVSEAERFAAGGSIEPLPGGRKATRREAGVLVVPLHKSGAPYRVAVSKATVEAAERVRAAGRFSTSVFYDVLRKAAKKCGVAGVLPGRFRHTTAKLAVEAGATVEQVGNYLGHKSPATTRRYYATLGLPMKIPTRR
jgi:integrase